MPEMLSWFLLVAISHAIFFFIILYIIVNLDRFKGSITIVSSVLNSRIEKYKEKRKNKEKKSKIKPTIQEEPIVDNEQQQYYESHQMIVKERINLKEIFVLVLLITWTLVVLAGVIYFFKTIGLF